MELDFIAGYGPLGFNQPKQPLAWSPLHPGLGAIPCFLDEADPRDAVTQINEHYSHGGGWYDFDGFTLTNVPGNAGSRWALVYPGDPLTYGVSEALLHDKERIVVFEHAWIAVFPENDMSSFRVARLD